MASVAPARGPAAPAARRAGRCIVVGTNETSRRLVSEWRARGLTAHRLPPERALQESSSGDVVLARLDVTETLDGVEPGLLALLLLERRGARVLNRVRSLLAAHDKLRTARALAQAGLPHPRTGYVRPGDSPVLEPPLVLKPRFGSWGRGIERGETHADLTGALERIALQPWFRRHGALVQRLLPASGRDLRVVVAGGRVVGAASRVAAPGEWRTNVSLGGTLEPATAPAAARALAAAAAAAAGTDLVGVDLLQVGDTWIVLELNGAVDFDERYVPPGADIFGRVAAALQID